jgi:hypothetical protein
MASKGLTAAHMLKMLGLGREQLALLRHYIGARLLPEQSDERHLLEAVQWLCRAQDVCDQKGVSAVYDLKSGWGVAYPETSGYIIATFLAYADIARDNNYVDRAIRIADWEIEIQTPGGGVLSSPLHSYTRVFNTGQVILGWCALYEKTHEDKYLRAAVRAGDYLVALQKADGSWQQNTYCGARTYHARIDWSLLRLASLSGENRFAECARRNIAWVLKQRRKNGWFDNCGFDNSLPIMHVIVYTLRGLLESHLAGAAMPDLLPAVIQSADALCAAVEEHPVFGIPFMVPSSFDENWKSSDRHSCLTGNAQLACFLFRLAHTTKNERYRAIADNVARTAKRTQIVDSPFPQIRGAIAGAFPMYQGYHQNSYPNWATKFFADALMMKMHFDEGITIAA